MKKLDVAVTGLGCVSPYGVGVDVFWRNLSEGATPFSEIDYFDATPFRNTLAGVVKDFKAEDKWSRADSFLRCALREACRDAGLDGMPESDVGMVLGTNFGPASATLDAIAGNGSAKPFGTGLDAALEVYGAKGPCMMLSLTCASGTAAIGKALSWVRTGRAKVVIAAGYDELSLHCYAGLSNLRAISKTKIKPFHAERDGTIFSEGAGVLVLESAESAAERGVKVHAWIRGYNVNNDAHHMTAPDLTAAGISSVMRGALEDANVTPDRVQHINCHATGTKYNDLIETSAIKQVFGNHARKLLITANKSCFGHAMGAAGTLEGIATVRTLEDSLVPPTASLDNQDPELDLDYCALKSRKADITYALSCNYGLGGANSAIVLEKA